jgi:hypothetical protein
VHLTSILAATVLGLSLIACSGSSTGSGNGSGAGGSVPPECTSGCTTYLQCKGLDASRQAECVQSCGAQGFTSEELNSYQGLDCPAYIAAIENHVNPNNPNPPAPGPAPKPKPAGVDCDGCQHDGSSCIWISPSTGAYQSCDASCC